MARILYVVICCALMGGYYFGMHWIFYSNPVEFALGASLGTLFSVSYIPLVIDRDYSQNKTPILSLLLIMFLLCASYVGYYAGQHGFSWLYIIGFLGSILFVMPLSYWAFGKDRADHLEPRTRKWGYW